MATRSKKAENNPDAEPQPTLADLRDLLIKLDKRVSKIEGNNELASTDKKSSDDTPLPCIPNQSVGENQTALIVGQVELFESKLNTLDSLQKVIKHVKDFRAFKNVRPGSQQLLASTVAYPVKVLLRIHEEPGYITDTQLIQRLHVYYQSFRIPFYEYLNVLEKVHINKVSEREGEITPWGMKTFRETLIYLTTIDTFCRLLKELTGVEVAAFKRQKESETVARPYSTVWQIVRDKLYSYSNSWYSAIVADVNVTNYPEWFSLSSALQESLKIKMRIMQENALLFQGAVEAHKTNASLSSRRADKSVAAVVPRDSGWHKNSEESSLKDIAEGNDSEKEEEEVDEVDEGEGEDIFRVVAAVNTDLEKRKKPCYLFMKGECKKGHACEYSHDKDVCDTFIKRITKYKE